MAGPCGGTLHRLCSAVRLAEALQATSGQRTCRGTNVTAKTNIRSPAACRGSEDEPAGQLISVVVPAFNSEETLAETLASVARQTHRKLEIIIVDDGSTDRTAQVAEQFCATEPRARLIGKPNGGVASARNLGI